MVGDSSPNMARNIVIRRILKTCLQIYYELYSGQARIDGQDRKYYFPSLSTNFEKIDVHLAETAKYFGQADFINLVKEKN